MTYNIPDALAPYLEYIPEDMLVDIITEALEEKIFRDDRTTSPAQITQQFDMNQLLEQLQGMLGSAAPQQLSKEVKEQVTKKEDSPIVITSASTEDVDEDLQDLVNGFAMDLFK